MSITELRAGKLAGARRIARSLGEVEAAIDTSIIHQAQLLASIVEGRMAAGTAIQVGHSAFRRAVDALEALATARDHVVGCHDELAEVRDQLRLAADDVGCSGDKLTRTIGRAAAA